MPGTIFSHVFLSPSCTFPRCEKQSWTVDKKKQITGLSFGLTEANTINTKHRHNESLSERFFGRKSLPPAAPHGKWRRALTRSKVTSHTAPLLWLMPYSHFPTEFIVFSLSSLLSPPLPFHRRCPARSLESAARQRRFEETRKKTTTKTLEALSNRRCTIRPSTSLHLKSLDFGIKQKDLELGGPSCLFVYEYKMIKHTTNLRWQAWHLKGEQQGAVRWKNCQWCLRGSNAGNKETFRVEMQSPSWHHLQGTLHLIMSFISSRKECFFYQVHSCQSLFYERSHKKLACTQHRHREKWNCSASLRRLYRQKNLTRFQTKLWNFSLYSL